MHCKRHFQLFMAAGLAALTAASHAGSDINLYGRAHVSLSHLDDGADYAALNVASNSSIIGVAGRHRLNDDWHAVAQFEGRVDIDQADDRFSFSSRNAFGGFQSEQWGLLRVGQFDTPLKRLQNSVALFRDRIGDARNITRSRQAVGDEDGDPSVNFDARFPNAIGYTTPARLPVVLSLAYATDTNENTAADGNRDDAFSGSLAWSHNGLLAAVAHEQWRFGDDRLNEREATRVILSQEWEQWTLNGFFQTTTHPNDETYGLGTRYQITERSTLMAQHYRLYNEEDNDANMFSLGGETQVTEQLTLYATAARLNNRGKQSLVPWREGTTLSASGNQGINADGQTAWALSGGVRYVF